MCEENSDINYKVLGISQERNPLTNKPKITNPLDRPLSLAEKRLQIISVAEYQAQKPWFEKVDPYFLHSAEEQAAEASRSGVGPSIPAAKLRAKGEKVEEEEEEDFEDADRLIAYLTKIT